jgi:hypothetical protein
MHSRWSRPGMDAVGFGSEVTGVAVFVAGMGNLGRSLTALPVPVPHGELRVRGPYRWVQALLCAGRPRLRTCSPPSHPAEIRSDCWQSSRSVNGDANCR